MQLYQYSQMEQEFGKIRKGEEAVYSMLLLPKYIENFLYQIADV